MTKYTRVVVWKHECRPSRNGCARRAAARKTRFSDLVDSTSSFSMMNSFLSTLIAYRWPERFFFGKHHLAEVALASTARKLKSSRPILRREEGACGEAARRQWAPWRQVRRAAAAAADQRRQAVPQSRRLLLLLLLRWHLRLWAGTTLRVDCGCCIGCAGGCC